MHTWFESSPRPRGVALIRVTGLSPVGAFLRRIGAPVERLLARSGLPTSVFDDPEALIPHWQAFRFMQDSARQTGIDDLILLAGRDMRVEALGVFGRVIRRSRTLHEAIETAISALPAFSSGGRLWLASEGDRVRLCHQLEGLYAAYGRVDQYWSMVALSVLRLGGSEFLSNGAIGSGRHGVTITFPQSLLNRPLAPASGARRIDDTEIDAWRACGPAADFPGSVLQVMTTLSSPEYPRIGRTANAIGMSVRALQRRLADAGVSYAGLVARSRFATAVDLLERTDATVLDIALDLGYSDHAHFTRAFRRWTGVAPRDFRRVSRRTPGTSPTLRSRSGRFGARTVAV